MVRGDGARLQPQRPLLTVPSATTTRGALCGRLFTPRVPGFRRSRRVVRKVPSGRGHDAPRTWCRPLACSSATHHSVGGCPCAQCSGGTVACCGRSGAAIDTGVEHRTLVDRCGSDQCLDAKTARYEAVIRPRGPSAAVAFPPNQARTLLPSVGEPVCGVRTSKDF